MWWSPNPRAILHCEDIHVNRTLAKFIRKRPFTVTINNAFSEVIDACSDAPFRQEESWITSDMITAYEQLHQLGFAHSIEVWQEDALVGGLYGVAINGYFSGESMFYSQANASKIALFALSKHLLLHGINMIDCQIQNDFLASMGSQEISRQHFLNQQSAAINQTVSSELWRPQTISY